MSALLASLTLQAGYNASVVTLGAAAIGAAAGAVGAFLLLRKRVLVSDAISHATLPGIGLAFLIMAALGGEGRDLIGLLSGAAASAFLGLIAVEWLTRRTRLPEDAAIGAVLASLFGLGVVLMTIIQSAGIGRPAGLSGFLVGQTASMLASEAIAIGIGTLVVAAALFVLARPLTILAFDPDFAATRGIDARRYDRALLVLALFVVVLGLKIAGLVLIVALTIIPPAAARFWTASVTGMVAVAAAFGAAGGYLGAALSASFDHLPTGPVIVLSSVTIFALSALWHARPLVTARAR